MHVVSNFLHLIIITWSLKLLKPIYFLTHMVCSPIQFNFCPLILFIAYARRRRRRKNGTGKKPKILWWFFFQRIWNVKNGWKPDLLKIPLKRDVRKLPQTEGNLFIKSNKRFSEPLVSRLWLGHYHSQFGLRDMDRSKRKRFNEISN